TVYNTRMVRSSLYQMIILATLLVLLVASATKAAPHILLMMLDDIGRADTGIYGDGGNIQLPTLKNLAKEGVVFENMYTQTVCSPTRSSILTGLYPFRFGMQHLTVHHFLS